MCLHRLVDYIALVLLPNLLQLLHRALTTFLEVFSAGFTFDSAEETSELLLGVDARARVHWCATLKGSFVILLGLGGRTRLVFGLSTFCPSR